MTPHALLFTIAAIGISETTYLIRKRFAKERPVCVVGERCHEVLESKYNRLFGIPNDTFGLAFYIVVAVFTALLIIGVPHAPLLDLSVRLLVLGGLAVSAVLVFLQWKIIRAWCFWCVLSAATTFVMGFIVLLSNLTVI